MHKPLKILIVDDHQLILDGIVASLEKVGGYEISTATDCDAALLQLKQAHFDILFTDLSFDATDHSVTIESGEDLIKAVKKESIAVKVGVITGHSETNRVYNVIRNLAPLAYVLKHKCDADELDFAIKKMMKNDVYYTHEVHQKLLKRACIAIQMDEVAIQILRELPKQLKISNLVGVIKKEDGSLLKLRSIEGKLANLKVDLNAVNNTDLILKAKELGIID